jgi:hypothetical protein
MKVKKVIEEEVDVHFPCYQKGLVTYVLWLSEEESIWIENSICFHGIKENHILLYHEFGEPCTEEEFKSAYQEALNREMLNFHNLFSKENEFIKNEGLKQEGY